MRILSSRASIDGGALDVPVAALALYRHRAHAADRRGTPPTA